MKNTNRGKAINYIIVVLAMMIMSSVISSSALAIGITPGRTTIDFEPGLEKEVHFTVINNENKDMNVLLYVDDGAYDTFITLFDSVVTFRSDEQSKGFSYRINLPDEMDKPGTHEIDIIAMEMPGKDTEGMFVGATTAVVTQALVRVPYPGKYVVADLAVKEAGPGEPVNFFVKSTNLGTDNVLRAQAIIDIFGPTNEKIATIETAEAGIGAKSGKEFQATWNADVKAGVYHAVVTLRYDADIGGGVTTVEKNFAIGNLYIDITDINVKNFRLGGVAKFNIMAESKWNQQVNGVYGNMIIEDAAGNSVADINTATVSIDPLGKNELFAFWDTDGVKAGDYDARFILHYEGRTTEKDLLTHVTINDISVDILGLGVGAVTREPAQGEGTDNMILILVVVLIVINVGWFTFFRKRRQNR